MLPVAWQIVIFSFLSLSSFAVAGVNPTVRRAAVMPRVIRPVMGCMRVLLESAKWMQRLSRRLRELVVLPSDAGGEVRTGGHGFCAALLIAQQVSCANVRSGILKIRSEFHRD